MIRVTPVIKNLLIINVVIWILLSVLGETSLQPLQYYFVLFKSNTILNHGDYGLFHPAQLATYFFNHGGLLHIVFNMYVLASLGPLVEQMWGAKPFLRFYLFCGVFGGLLVALFDPSPIPVVGASGAILGLMVAFAQMFPNHRLGILFIPVSFKAKDFVLGIGVISVIFIYLQEMGLSDGGGISHFGHLAGMVAALIFYQLARYFPILMQK